MEGIDVLVVFDEDPYTADLAASVARQAGYRVEKVFNSLRALDTVRSLAPRLILLDTRIPGIDGPALCRKLQSDAKTSSVPVIVISEGDPEPRRAAAWACGASAFHPTPFKTSALAADLEALLGPPGRKAPRPPIPGRPVFAGMVWGSGTAGLAGDCVSLSLGRRLAILDAGPGLNELARAPDLPGEAWLFLSRMDDDAVAGLPALRRLIASGLVLSVAAPLSPQETRSALCASMGRAAASAPSLYSLSEGKFNPMPDVRLSAFPTGPDGAAFALKFQHRGRSLAFCPGIDGGRPGPGLLAFLSGSDALLFDARCYEDPSLLRSGKVRSGPSLLLEELPRTRIPRLLLFGIERGPEFADRIVSESRARLRAAGCAAEVSVADAGFLIEV
jgi:CheY-like chemotaxis protein